MGEGRGPSVQWNQRQKITALSHPSIHHPPTHQALRADGPGTRSVLGQIREQSMMSDLTGLQFKREGAVRGGSQKIGSMDTHLHTNTQSQHVYLCRRNSAISTTTCQHAKPLQLQVSLHRAEIFIKKYKLISILTLK